MKLKFTPEGKAIAGLSIAELQVAAAAAELSCDYINSLIEGDRFGGSLPRRGRAYQVLKSRREAIREYRSFERSAALLLRQLERARKGGRP